MISKIHNSVFSKHIALLLAVSILTMSFRTRSNEDVILNAGTSVPLETISMIQSDQVSVGQTIDFRVKYDVKVGEATVIKAGSTAKGQVMRAQKAKGLGKEGFVESSLNEERGIGVSDTLPDDDDATSVPLSLLEGVRVGQEDVVVASSEEVFDCPNAVTPPPSTSTSASACTSTSTSGSICMP